MQQSLHQYLLPLYWLLALYKWPQHKVIRPVELLVVLTRAAVTQLAAAGQQLAVAQPALAAILTFGQKCIDLKNRKRMCYLNYPHLLFINI
jgi:hypothetical protein